MVVLAGPCAPFCHPEKVYQHKDPTNAMISGMPPYWAPIMCKTIAFGLFSEVLGHDFTFCWGPGTANSPHKSLLSLQPCGLQRINVARLTVVQLHGGHRILKLMASGTESSAFQQLVQTASPDFLFPRNRCSFVARLAMHA